MGKYSALARAFWDFGNWYTDLDAQKMCPKTLTSQKACSHTQNIFPQI